MGFCNISRWKQRTPFSSVVKTKNSSFHASWLWFAMKFISSSKKWVQFHFLFTVIFLCVSRSSCDNINRRHHLALIHLKRAIRVLYKRVQTDFEDKEASTIDQLERLTTQKIGLRSSQSLNNVNTISPNFTYDPYSSIIKLIDNDVKGHKYSGLGVTKSSIIDEELKTGLQGNSEKIASTSEEDEENQDSSESENASPEDVLQQNNLEAPDTLDSLLNFLKTSGSPVSGLLDLRSLLLEQKEEKIMLRTLVDQMKVDIAGLRYLLKLQSEELQIHAAEITDVRKTMERGKLSRELSRRHTLLNMKNYNRDARKMHTSTDLPQASIKSQKLRDYDTASILSTDSLVHPTSESYLNEFDNETEQNDFLIQARELMVQQKTTLSEVNQLRTKITEALGENHEMKRNIDKLKTEFQMMQRNQIELGFNASSKRGDDGNLSVPHGYKTFPSMETHERLDDVETKVRNLLENRKHTDEEQMRLKDDLSKMQNSHDKIIQDIQGIDNQIFKNRDLAQKIYSSKSNEIENSSNPFGFEAINTSYDKSMFNELTNSMNTLKEDVQRIDLQYQQQALKDSKITNNTKYSLSEDNIKNIVEMKLQEVYKMSPWQELNMYKNKMNEQHQHVMSALGDLEGKYNNVENKVNCVRCNQNVIENENKKISDIDINETIGIRKDESYGRIHQIEDEKIGVSQINDSKPVTCPELASRVDYIELELTKFSSKKESNELKQFVSTQLSNINGIVHDYGKKLGIESEAKAKLSQLDDIIELLENKTKMENTRKQVMAITNDQNNLNQIISQMNSKISDFGKYIASQGDIKGIASDLTTIVSELNEEVRKVKLDITNVREISNDASNELLSQFIITSKRLDSFEEAFSNMSSIQAPSSTILRQESDNAKASDKAQNTYLKDHTSVIQQMLKCIQDIHKQLNILKDKSRKEGELLYSSKLNDSLEHQSTIEFLLNDISNNTEKILKEHQFLLNKISSISIDGEAKTDYSNLGKEIETLKSSLKSETINVLGVIKDLNAQRIWGEKDKTRLTDIENRLELLMKSNESQYKNDSSNREFDSRLLAVEKECLVSKDNVAYVTGIMSDLKQEIELIRKQVDLFKKLNKHDEKSSTNVLKAYSDYHDVVATTPSTSITSQYNETTSSNHNNAESIQKHEIIDAGDVDMQLNAFSSEISKLKELHISGTTNIFGLFKDFEHKMRKIENKIKNILSTTNKTLIHDNEDKKAKDIDEKVNNILLEFEKLREDVSQSNREKESYSKSDAIQNLGSTRLPNSQEKQRNYTFDIESMSNTSKHNFANIYSILEDFDKKIAEIKEQISQIPTHFDAMPRQISPTVVTNTTQIQDEIKTIVNIISQVQKEISALRERQNYASNMELAQEKVLQSHENRIRANSMLKQSLMQNENIDAEINSVTKFRKQMNDEIKLIYIAIWDLQNETSILRKLQMPPTDYISTDRKNNQKLISSGLDRNHKNNTTLLKSDELEYIRKEIQQILTHFDSIKSSSSDSLKNVLAILKDFDQRIDLIDIKLHQTPDTEMVKQKESIYQAIQNISRMVEKMKAEHEDFRDKTSPHTNATSHLELSKTYQVSTFDDSDQNIGYNTAINKTIGDMQKVIYSQNNIDDELSKQISILYSMIEDLKKNLIQLSTPVLPQQKLSKNKENKISIEDIGAIKHELNTIKEKAVRDKVNTNEVVSNLSAIVVELKEMLVKKGNEYNSTSSNFDQNPAFNMSSKIDDVASKLLIKSKNEFEEFESMKHAQKSLKQEMDFIKKTIKGDTSNMLRLMQDLNGRYKKMNHSKAYEYGQVDFDSTAGEEIAMLKRKVELINSKEHSLSQRLMNVEDRILIALDKKPVKVMRHQGVEKHEFLALQTAVNDLQETCRYELSSEREKIQIHDKDINSLKDSQIIIEGEFIWLKSFVKNETSNTYMILKDLDTKTSNYAKNFGERKSFTSNGTQYTSQSNLAGLSSTDTIENEKYAINECMGRMDRIVQDQNNLNDSLKRQVDALFQNEQKAFDRLSKMEHEMKSKSLERYNWKERLNHMDKFLLELTQTINEIVAKISNKTENESVKKKQEQLFELRRSFENTLKTLKDFDLGLKGEKVDIEMLKKQLVSLENHISKTDNEQKSEHLNNAILDIKLEVNALSMALQRINSSRLALVENNTNEKDPIQHDMSADQSKLEMQRFSEKEHSTLVTNVTELGRKVENLIAAIDVLKRDSKIQSEKKYQYSTMSPYIVPSRKQELDRNFYTHDGQDTNDSYDGANKTLSFQLIDERQRNISPESNVSANEKSKEITDKKLLELSNGLKSVRQIMEEQGIKIETIFPQLQELRSSIQGITSMGPQKPSEPEGGLTVQVEELSNELNNVNRELSKVFHAISNSDSVYRTSMENVIKVIDGLNQRMSKVEKDTGGKIPKAIDLEMIKNLNFSVEELERKNKKISDSLDQTNYGLLQLGGQLNTARMQEDQFNRVEHNLTDLYTKLGVQENGLHETRSILLNTSLSKVKAENDELRQSVRIADNELKIIGLREEVVFYGHVIRYWKAVIQLVQMWDMIEELENSSNAHAKMNHVNKLNHEILQQRSQLGNITDALPIIKNRVNGIDEKIQKISSTLPNDCSQVGNDGVNLIQIKAVTGPTHVLCDNGKVVIQNRFDGSENFNRSWLDYKQGFGYPEKGDYWLGLEPIYQLISHNTNDDSNVSYGLDVDMWSSQGEQFTARYKCFALSSASDSFKLLLGPNSYMKEDSTISDALSYHDGQPFSTHDKDNDATSMDCAKQSQGGWWYRHCHNANLNGEFKLGMTWFDVTTRSWVHVVKSRMSLRKMISNHKNECYDKKSTSSEKPPYIYTTNQGSEKTWKANEPKMERQLILDNQKNEIPLTDTNDPLKKNIYFLNKVSPKHRLHTNYKIMSQQHDTRDYPDDVLYDNDDFELYYDDI